VASVITGVTRAEQVKQNVEAARWEPSHDALEGLAELGRPAQSYTTYAD
jgi:aryl-alcohol dehydrogenase-like predicted oxidoreductase